MIDILNKTYDELISYVESLGEKPFRGKQLWHWLWNKRVISFDEMHTLSRAFRETLSHEAQIIYPTIVKREQSSDGTIKMALSFEDGAVVETVLIPSEGVDGEVRVTQCVSTQVGCAMGCQFCSTARMGFIRNLSMREIVSQVLIGKAEYNDVRNAYPIVRNIVFMGMGEPFLNYKEVLRSLEVLGHKDGLQFSKNKMTVSTCGIVQHIVDFGRRNLGSLAVSLHATTQEQRARIMPHASKYSLETLLTVLEQYASENRSYITLEYVLLKDINDSVEDAKRLAKIAHKLKAKVNLLCYNMGKSSHFEPSSPERIQEFSSLVRSLGVVSVVRRSRGSDISAACGQLILEEIAQKKIVE